MNFYDVVIILFLLLIAILDTPKSRKYVFKRTFWFNQKLDDTDDLINREPSGLMLFIDHGTGVHYIKTPFGSLIPRLNKDGKIVNRYQQKNNKESKK